ncbi:MAG TPA: sulfate adenylyltransferase [Myxococcales bacterium]|nr:sulfate adenylyltransferase [Myxococcales bacterium]HIL02168.1 sulfate adenylyltransferase [Myxococcales bacterium]
MSKETQTDLVPVHGGLDEPIDRIVPLNQRSKFIAEASKLPSIRVSDADLSTVYRFSDGALSPLEGPMNEDEYNQVLDSSVIVRNGKRYAWTIPLSLPVTDEEAGTVTHGGSVAVVNASDEIIGIVEDAEVFAWDKGRYVESVYGTDRMDHPGGNMVESDPRGMLLGGRIRTLPQPVSADYGEFMLSPKMVRALIRDRKWERALAFQTRNPLHRAHEYALVCGVEKLTAEGHFTGAVLNPLVGELKGDDVPANVRMRCYRELHSKKLLGTGDKDESIWKSAGYELHEIFELIGLDIKMFYGGPKEAVMHGIYRQNYGFSDIVIGRKHADAPFADGSPIWGDFDAHEIFEKLEGDLRIQPCKIGFAAYYESLGRVDLTERHPDEKPFGISGTKVREQLKAGDRPDERIMRPETSDILIRAYEA